MDELKALDEKIELIRNDTNAYGFDDDNKNIAEALELVSNMLKSNDNSIGGKGEKGDKGEDGQNGKDGTSVVAVKVANEEEAKALSNLNPNNIYYWS